MITRRGSQTASNYLFLLCFFTNSSFLYQLDGLLESRGFEVNRRSISQSISQNAERDIGKACGLISNRDADSLYIQQTKSKVEAYFSGELTDSIEDIRCKKLLDEKVGSLIGMSTTEVARGIERVEQHRNRIHDFISENPSERQACLEVFTEPHGVSHLWNIRYAVYTDEKLSSIDKAYTTRDFDVCNLVRLPVNNKAQLLRRLLDVFNCGRPPDCMPLKAYDLTLKQCSYDEDERISVSDDIWRLYLQGRRTCKVKPTNRRGLMQCIAALAKELFGKRFLEKTETCKRGKRVKKMYNYKTNTAILNIAMRIMAWQDRQEDIDPEFARLYGPYLLTLG